MACVAVRHPVHAVADIDDGAPIWRNLRIGGVLHVEYALSGETLALICCVRIGESRRYGHKRRDAGGGGDTVKFHGAVLHHP